MPALLIEGYEGKHHPLPRISPNESLNELMEERGVKRRDGRSDGGAFLLRQTTSGSSCWGVLRSVFRTEGISRWLSIISEMKGGFKTKSPYQRDTTRGYSR